MVSMATKRDHYHMFEKLSNGRYRCGFADCPYVNSAEAIKGKFATCPSCFETYIMDRHAMRVRKPKCPNCRGKQGFGTTRRKTQQLAPVENFDAVLAKALGQTKGKEPE